MLAVRPYTSATPPPPPPPARGGGVSVKAGFLFAGLSAFAVALTVYGVWDYFAAFRVWPKELREPLRAGLKARNKGQWEYSATKFREALRIAHTLDDAKIGSDRLLKTTGIAIALASVLEEDEKWQDAALVYVDALDEVLERGESRSPPETMRGVALAQKVGELAQHDGVLVPPCAAADHEACQTSEPAEGYLAWSVEEMLRLVRVPRSEGPVVLADLALPAWVSAQDLGASVEALGAFYASHQQADLAVPLYLQAISTLLPPKTEGQAPPTVADRCRAAILMNNISQALTQKRTDTETLLKAMAWATKGLDLATLTSHRAGFLAALPPEERALLLQISGHDPRTVAPVAPVIETATEARLEQVKQQCLGTQFVLLYNLGMFYSMNDDKDTARILFLRAMRQAEFMQLREARTQCARALKRLERA
ncbi:hypothetical protein MCAP1_000378 [Malassezia caprae]|uniref:Uncharacterized protein n=1 Tax=Malassezia caprae TaxID=1381934 RepID=A0AAF0E3B3_9BASI|nr:hypothetical protein MCAP1_000378 [Malassezia caprae]